MQIAEVRGHCLRHRATAASCLTSCEEILFIVCIVLYLIEWLMSGNQLEVPTGTMMKHVIEHKYVYLRIIL